MSTDTDTDTKRKRGRGRGRKVWRAIKAALPALWRAIAASSDEVLEALADGRITPQEAMRIGFAFAEGLADDDDDGLEGAQG